MTINQIKSRKIAIETATAAAKTELMEQYGAQKFNKKELEKCMTAVNRWNAEQHKSLYAAI